MTADELFAMPDDVYRARDDVRAYDGDEEIDLGDAVPGWRFKLAELSA